MTLGSFLDTIQTTDYRQLLVGVVSSITIGEFFLFAFLTLMFVGINVIGYANYYLFKKKRKRLFYLDKIDESTGDYQGAMT